MLRESNAIVALRQRRFPLTSPAKIVTFDGERTKSAPPEDWHDKEYRDAIVQAGIEQDIAWQIRTNRQARNLTQAQFAKMLGTRQPAVQRMEDPEYGKHSLATLVKVASVFDCALQVRLLPFSEFATISENLTPAAQYAAPFTQEYPHEQDQSS